MPKLKDWKEFFSWRDRQAKSMPEPKHFKKCAKKGFQGKDYFSANIHKK